MARRSEIPGTLSCRTITMVAAATAMVTTSISMVIVVVVVMMRRFPLVRILTAGVSSSLSL